MSIPAKMSFSVSIPSENGFYGRECNSPKCKKYFKIHEASFAEEMYCPYCGDRFKKNQLWSSDQLEYAKKVALEEVQELVHRAFQNMLKRSFSGSKNITYKPGRPYRKKAVSPPQEITVDSELCCPSCNSSFQVYGIFGYCPICKSENILLYDANWEIIKIEIRASDNPERALRHAYSDLVSTFEMFCRKKARAISIEHGRFQNIEHTRKLFKKHLQIDIFATLAQGDIRTIRRVFEKRHVAEHNDGVISQRYIQQMPEDAELLGSKAILSIEELESAAKIMKSMLDELL